MRNLWEETIEKLKNNGKTFEDVIAVYGTDFLITKENFEKVAKETDYDAGYGGQEIARDLKILGVDFLMTRNEYDGSEWWDYFPVGNGIPKNFMYVIKLKNDNYWCETLSEMNGDDSNDEN